MSIYNKGIQSEMTNAVCTSAYIADTDNQIMAEMILFIF